MIYVKQKQKHVVRIYTHTPTSRYITVKLQNIKAKEKISKDLRGKGLNTSEGTISLKFGIFTISYYSRVKLKYKQKDQDNLSHMTLTEIAERCNSRIRKMNTIGMIQMPATMKRTEKIKYVGKKKNTHNVACF